MYRPVIKLCIHEYNLNIFFDFVRIAQNSCSVLRRELDMKLVDSGVIPQEVGTIINILYSALCICFVRTCCEVWRFIIVSWPKLRKNSFIPQLTSLHTHTHTSVKAVC